MGQAGCEDPEDLLKPECPSCWDRSNVIKCDNETDTMKCRVCGRIWTRPCNFDEDFS